MLDLWARCLGVPWTEPRPGQGLEFRDDVNAGSAGGRLCEELFVTASGQRGHSDVPGEELGTGRC